MGASLNCRRLNEGDKISSKPSHSPQYLEYMDFILYLIEAKNRPFDFPAHTIAGGWSGDHAGLISRTNEFESHSCYMQPKSAKNKGRRFENYINQQIEECGFGRAIRTPGSGSGKIKGDSFNSLDFLLEIKNQKNIQWYQCIDQAKIQAVKGNFNRYQWALIVRDPRTPEDNPDIYAVIDFWQLLKLIKDAKQPISKEPDREMKYALQRLVDSAKAVMKRLEL